MLTKLVQLLHTSGTTFSSAMLEFGESPSMSRSPGAPSEPRFRPVPGRNGRILSIVIPLLRSHLVKPGQRAASDPDVGVGVGSLVRMTRGGRRRLLVATASTILLIAGCESLSEAFNDFTEKFSPPSPFQAAVWASDFNDPGLQRRGVILLSNATFGGERTYVDLYRALSAARRARAHVGGRRGPAREAALGAMRASGSM